MDFSSNISFQPLPIQILVISDSIVLAVLFFDVPSLQKKLTWLHQRIPCEVAEDEAFCGGDSDGGMCRHKES